MLYDIKIMPHDFGTVSPIHMIWTKSYSCTKENQINELFEQIQLTILPVSEYTSNIQVIKIMSLQNLVDVLLVNNSI